MRRLAARYGPCALILGGSEGIGAAFAQRLAAAGFALILVARTREPLEVTASALRDAHGVEIATASIDLSAADAVERVMAAVGSRTIGLVIANAGATHGVGRFLDQSEDKAQALLRLNAVTTVGVLHRLLAPMRARRRGGAILLSSTSALAGSGLTAVYAASKAFVLSLAEGLHRELAADGIDILCVVAGLTATPAMARSGILERNVSGYAAMAADEVANQALAALGTRPVWYAAGDEAVAAMRAMPRTDLVERMTQGASALFGVPI